VVIAVDLLPLRPGDRGDAVRDLQQRLTAVGGAELAIETRGTYGPATAAAVTSFQRLRGLPLSGVCDQATRTALVEAGYRPGDRLLYLRSPMQRGDDVADLQRALGVLGFDAGRVDGIFGPQTERALIDFQRNVGLSPDGTCGSGVWLSLGRIGHRAEHSTNVAGVRERELLRSQPPVLTGRRIVLGESGGLDVLVTAIGRVLHDAGAIVAFLHHPQPSVQAVEANDFRADVYLGFSLMDLPPCETAYYATEGFESSGGHRLAELLVDAWRGIDGLAVGAAHGRWMPILRETRMPAVDCGLGPPTSVVERTAELAQATQRALGEWVATPVDA
jgi:N-acetylmuramoyl-L-alanine amidase